MAEHLEGDNSRQIQSAAEAVEVLKQSGFLVGDVEVETETEEPFFDLELSVALPKMERPLEALSPCERDGCPRGE